MPFSFAAHRRAAHLTLGACALLSCAAAQALTGRVVATGFTEPVFLTAPARASAVYVVEKAGRIIRVDARGRTQVYLDIRSLVDSNSERGLLGLAFDPNFARNGRLYVYYIDVATRDSVVARYTASSASATTVDPATAEEILRVDQPPNTPNHKAGWIAFRPGDRRNLYIATGDGGPALDRQNAGQNLGSLLAKILRVDVSGTGPGYALPLDNPFINTPEARGEIWALGLRNPWRNSFDRRTGDMWVADVGENTREELNFEPAGSPGGANYGWSLREGSVRTPLIGGNKPGLTEPVFDYPHSGAASLGRSIIGGYVYRGPSIPEADGRYFFADFVSNRIFSTSYGPDGTPLDVTDETAELLTGTGVTGVSSFGEDGLGGLYMLGIEGTIVAICGNTPAPRGPCADRAPTAR